VGDGKRGGRKTSSRAVKRGEREVQREDHGSGREGERWTEGKMKEEVRSPSRDEGGNVHESIRGSGSWRMISDSRRRGVGDEKGKGEIDAKAKEKRRRVSRKMWEQAKSRRKILLSVYQVSKGLYGESYALRQQVDRANLGKKKPPTRSDSVNFISRKESNSQSVEHW